MASGLFDSEYTIQAQLNSLSARSYQLSHRHDVQAMKISELKDIVAELRKNDIDAAKLVPNDPIWNDERGLPVMQLRTIAAIGDLEAAEAVMEDIRKEMQKVADEIEALMER